jgi:hypothetical protein
MVSRPNWNDEQPKNYRDLLVKYYAFDKDKPSAGLQKSEVERMEAARILLCSPGINRIETFDGKDTKGILLFGEAWTRYEWWSNEGKWQGTILFPRGKPDEKRMRAIAQSIRLTSNLKKHDPSKEALDKLFMPASAASR